MTKTARQVIDDAVIRWLDNEDIGRFTEVQRLEHATGIWEYGKWCAKGARHRLGYCPQISYRGSPPDATAWDGLRDISDDEGMRIHAATIGLDSAQLEILERVYIAWQPVDDAISQMRMGMTRFYKVRRDALEAIEIRLTR